MSINEKIICVSGYFNPLHAGHIEYFEKSKALGTKLIVIVNNDKQSMLKKGSSFMNENERLRIIRSLKVVDFAVLSIDDDRTVCKTLESIRPHVFTNGGDQFNSSSFFIASIKSCAVIFLLWSPSMAVFPLNSINSAVIYSRTAAKYTGAPSPT